MNGDSSIELTALPNPKTLPKEIASPTEPTSHYLARITHAESRLVKYTRQSKWIAIARLLAFISFVILSYLAFNFAEGYMMIPAMAVMGVFLYLVKRAARAKRILTTTQILIKVNEDEISAIRGDQRVFDAGTEFVDAKHEFSFDLDIFGEKSIYQLLCRATTPLGKQRLAERLMHPDLDSDKIRIRQESVKELSKKLNWRQDFRVTGLESDWDQKTESRISTWLGAPDRFTGSRWYLTAIALNLIVSFSVLMVLMLRAAGHPVMPSVSISALLLYFVLPVGFIFSQSRQINREQQKLDRQLNLFRKYSGLLEQIERESFASVGLNELKNRLKHGSVSASEIMRKLTNILWGLEVRGNLIVSFLLNAIFLWDIIMMIRLERWRKHYRDEFGKWIEIIAEFEVLSSLAGLAFNRPDLNWPEIRDGEFSMEIRKGGHPLIDPSRRVDNSLNFNPDGLIYLITGANMAGKSTLLRMTGVNMILAMAGAPVCAEQMNLVPTYLFTSVRTNDSLGDDESYFYAELKRLSRLIGLFQSGRLPFIIIDEMLRGTNSRDKHAGSAALIRRLVGFGASGLVATHDVDLGELEQEFPGRLENRCFEVTSQGDSLNFDYLLYPGVSRNLNATFLMKRMGIIDH